MANFDKQFDGQFDEQCDEQLRKLALEAQQQPQHTLSGRVARSKALGQLMVILQQSGKLCSPNRTYGAQYQEVKDEGLAQLYFWICKNIDKYNPERGEVLQWVNNRLQYIYIEAYRELNTEGRARPPRLSLDDLNHPQIAAEEPEETLSQQLRHCLEEDSTGEFQRNHIKGYPRANFQFIALKRIDGYSWQEVSQNLHNIQVSTLSSFYQRTLEKSIPLLQDCLSD